MTNPIREAVENLSGHWHQGGYNSEDGNNSCALGHLRSVMGFHENYDNFDYTEWRKCIGILNRTSGAMFPDRTSQNIVIFNDHPDTTEDDVIAVMEKAAVRYDEIV